MIETVGPALEQALAYHRAPGMLPAAHGRPLPESMLTLLRLAGGDQALAAQCAASSGEAESEVVAAAVFFIQQVMFVNGSDSYRVLGVNPDAPDARIKEHYRWLVRWLHPDRNTDDWDSVYADRVNVAWQTLRLPERRREYDLARVEQVPALEGFPRPRAAPVHIPVHEPAMLSSSTVQRLPVLVLGGLGGFAVVVLFLMWLGADQGGRERGRRVAADAAEPVEAPAALANAATDPAGPPASDAVATQVAPAVSLPPAAPAPVPVPAAAPTNAAVPPPLVTVARSPTVPDSRPPTAAPERASPRQDPATTLAEATAAPPPQVAQQAPLPPSTLPPVTPPAPRKPAVVPPAQVPAAVAAAGNGAPAPLLQEAQAHALMQEFGEAYQSGDINALMRLFTADARNNRGGREAIVYDYQSLFSATESRRLDLKPTGWILRGEGGTLLANYRARVRSSGKLRADVSEGTIRFDLKLVDGRVRISQVRHDDGA